MIYLPKSEFYKLDDFESLYSSNLKFADENTLYKAFRQSMFDWQIDFVKYLNEMPPIEGLLLPIDLIIDEEIYGYAMPYIKNAQNIEDYLCSPKIDVDIIQTIKNMYRILRKIHEYIIIGDIRNTNILITSESSCVFIDVEDGKKVDSNKNLITYYNIFVNKQFISNNKLNDLLKTFMSALSLYYDISLEKYFRKRDICELLEILKVIKASSNLTYYLECLINNAMNKKDDCDIPFEEIIEFIDMPTESEKEKLRRTLPRPLY